MIMHKSFGDYTLGLVLSWLLSFLQMLGAKIQFLVTYAYCNFYPESMTEFPASTDG